MSVVSVEVVASNYLEQCYEVHCEYKISDGGLEDTLTCRSLVFRAPFCRYYKAQIEISQIDEGVSAKLAFLAECDSVYFAYSVYLVKCDGVRLAIHDADNNHRVVDFVHEYFHDEDKLFFRFVINIKNPVSQEREGQLLLLKSIDGPFNDFEIEASGGSVKVIKNILAVKWKYFATKLKSPRMELADNKWIVEDVSLNVMKDIVSYVYSDAITLKNKNHAVKLAKAGCRFSLDNLVGVCEKYLCAEVNSGSSLSLLVIGDQYQLISLKQKCLTFVTKAALVTNIEDMDGYDDILDYDNHGPLMQYCFEAAVRKKVRRNEPSTASVE
ncbi:Protein maternal effect lethal 26 [Halotydeus destructor]|nr:Protein maternal effect lethal 26 [Halotydeus destructor]